MITMMLAAALVASPVSADVQPAAPVQAVSGAIDPQRLALGRELIAIVLPPAQRQQMMSAILNSMMQNMVGGMERAMGTDLTNKPATKAVFDRFIERQRKLGIADLDAAMPDLVEAYAHAYARNFSLEELQQIKGFLSTPTGAKFMQRAPSLLADPDVAAMMKRMTQAGAERLPAEMQQFKSELMAAEKTDTARGH